MKILRTVMSMETTYTRRIQGCVKVATTAPLKGMFGPLVMESEAVRLSGQRETLQVWPVLLMEQIVMVDRPVMVRLW